MNPFSRKVPKFSAPESDLTELIRIERDAGTTRVFRVCSEREIGYLHFRHGRLVHAAMKNIFGMQALRTIVAWADASFDPCDVEVSTLETITTAEFAELLGDEETNMNRDQSDNVIVIAQPSAPASVPGNTVLPSPPSSGHADDAGDGDAGWPLSFEDCETAVLLSPEGHLVASKGTADDLCDLAAYVTRLGQLIADALGMEELIAVECASDADAFLIYEAVGGKTVAVKGKDRSTVFSTIKSKLDL